jgi:hypothetical protein
VLGLVIEVEEDNDEVESEEQDEEDDRFAVWPENWESLMFFLACSSQWNVVTIPRGEQVGLLYYIGLRYEGCGALINDFKIKDRKQMWQDLRVMEAEAKSALNQRLAS